MSIDPSGATGFFSGFGPVGIGAVRPLASLAASSFDIAVFLFGLACAQRKTPSFLTGWYCLLGIRLADHQSENIRSVVVTIAVATITPAVLPVAAVTAPVAAAFTPIVSALPAVSVTTELATVMSTIVTVLSKFNPRSDLRWLSCNGGG